MPSNWSDIALAVLICVVGPALIFATIGIAIYKLNRQILVDLHVDKDGACPQCDYDLRVMFAQGKCVCPECGFILDRNA